MAALLVDEGISRDLVQQLVGQGFSVIHWLAIGPKGTHDSLVFLAAQHRSLTVFTWNRDDFVFAAICWQNWGHGDHHSIIVPKQGKYRAQLPPAQLYPILVRHCADTSSFVNRIEWF
jgi:Domain of unknown function (DUF5615)